MKNIQDFISQIENYFGSFQNDMIRQLFAEMLAKVKPNDYENLFVNIITHNPATWHPDVKTLSDAISALHLVLIEPVSNSKCPVCGQKGAFRGGTCLYCKYTPATDGDPEKYREWWSRWQRGEEPHFDISDICKIGKRLDVEKELKNGAN